MKSIKFIETGSYKVGINEVEGLKAALESVLKPVQSTLKNKVYWNECEFSSAEYLSRDGFSANKDNCGGIILDLVIPSCEGYEFPFLEFGECDGCNEDCSACRADDPNGKGECCSESDGHLDARLRIWLKFEGIDQDTGKLKFYLNASGGNGDAPYFRPHSQPTLFEAEFECSSVAGVKRAAAKHVAALVKLINSK
jgi:hypothetical protein